MKRIILFYYSRSNFVRILVGSFTSAGLFYLAALLSSLVSEIAKLDKPLTLGLHAAVFITFFTCVVAIARYAVFVRERIHQEEIERRAALLHAYTFVDRIVTKRLADLHGSQDLVKNFIQMFITSVECLQRIIEAAYHAFEAAFGKSVGLGKRTDFEVTFMTKSYADGKITIPACANREGRAPRSMVLREKNPEIYDNTITAAIYRESRPSIHIIKETNNDKNYHELYPGEKQRIKSSIIYPVLSDKNELLGTLVVHCDQAGFFQHTHEKYWIDLLEIFVKHISLMKARMDLLVELNKSGQKEINISLPNDFF